MLNTYKKWREIDSREGGSQLEREGGGEGILVEEGWNDMVYFSTANNVLWGNEKQHHFGWENSKK